MRKLVHGIRKLDQLRAKPVHCIPVRSWDQTNGYTHASRPFASPSDPLSSRGRNSRRRTVRTRQSGFPIDHNVSRRTQLPSLLIAT